MTIVLQRMIKRITNEQLNKTLKAPNNLQQLFDKLELDRARNVQAKSRKFLATERGENSYEEKLKRLKTLELEVPKLEEMVEHVASDKKLSNSYSHSYYEKNRELNRLREELDAYEAYRYVNDIFQFSYAEDQIEALDGLADYLGKWFEEGHLGAGSVTYVNKTYTFQG